MDLRSHYPYWLLRHGILHSYPSLTENISAEIAQRPHTYFALGFGGNGITFSIVAAQIIRDILKRKKNDDIETFSFNR